MSSWSHVLSLSGGLSVCAALILSSGCATTARIESAPVQRLQSPAPASITVLKEALDGRRNKSDQVGRHTFTVFMIPTVGVFAEDPVEKSVGDLFTDVLKQRGYQVSVVEKLGTTSKPVLAVQVDSIRNYLFSWLWPLGLTGGRAQLTPVLFSEDGKILWKGKPCAGWGGCPSVIYMCGFETSIYLEMSSVMRQIADQLSSQEFIQKASAQ